MLGRTHAFTGLFVGLLFASTLSTSFFDKFLLVLVSIFASLFPDLDSPKSYLGRHVKLIGILTKHRGILHSIFPLIGIYVLINYFVGPSYAFAFAIGFASHILLDMITREGIHFFPFGFHFRGPVRVGGFLEYVFLLGQIFIMVIFFT